jgi:23S rRNA (cytosine1962-C5)-methyltransferase
MNSDRSHFGGSIRPYRVEFFMIRIPRIASAAADIILGYFRSLPTGVKSRLTRRKYLSGRGQSTLFRKRMIKPRKARPLTTHEKPKADLTDAPAERIHGDSPSAPGARINRRAADRLRGGYLWVYASDIEAIELPQTGASPALLPVADSRGLLLGTALYSPSSQIALRLVSRSGLDEAGWLQLLATRLRAAIARRKPMLDDRNNACRLCFSEADELPGLVADKYGDLVILQLLTKGLDSAAVRETCVRVLREELAPAAILERPDPRMRELEGLASPSAEPLFVAHDVKLQGAEEMPAGAKALNDFATSSARLKSCPDTKPGSSAAAHITSIQIASTRITSTQFLLNGLKFYYDADAGQKTGAFLDQRTNYAAAQEWARRLGADGRALDVCCYQGGYALHLAQVCRQVTGIDASRASLEVAERNLEANRARLTAQVDWLEGDAFQILRDWLISEAFDAIVLDPPAFAKTKRAVEGALRGYKELNLRALKMLQPGGLLVTCSCSHHVSWADLESAVASAAADAGRRVRLLERRGAAPDHPVVLNLPETEYLKCLVLEVE